MLDDLDSQYILEHNKTSTKEAGMDEEMTDVDTETAEVDNVFVPVIQDFGSQRQNEAWVSLGETLTAYRRPHQAQPHLETRPPLRTQFIVVMKGIGTNTFQCLKDKPTSSGIVHTGLNNPQERSRRYLRQLMSSKVDYMDKEHSQARVAMQNIPLVYGESMLGSEMWADCREYLENAWYAKHGSHDNVGNSADEGMTAVEYVSK